MSSALTGEKSKPPSKSKEKAKAASKKELKKLEEAKAQKAQLRGDLVKNATIK